MLADFNVATLWCRRVLLIQDYQGEISSVFELVFLRVNKSLKLKSTYKNFIFKYIIWWRNKLKFLHLFFPPVNRKSWSNVARFAVCLISLIKRYNNISSIDCLTTLSLMKINQQAYKANQPDVEITVTFHIR